MSLEARPLAAGVWRSCAGAGARVPAVGSRVFYFPQGHTEQASSPPDLSACRLLAVPCLVAAVQLLADPDTDEVFAKIRLHPKPSLSPTPPPPEAAKVDCGDGGGDRVVSFAKILTPSDANNGGGFSVPRFCADSIFPSLDFKADPPVQTIVVRDVHGTRWEFRHIYRGTPRRHLLTTGWSKFVNSKKLVAGDSVVFMRDPSGELCVGVRRIGRSCGSSLPDYSIKLEENLGGGGGPVSEGFSRSGRGRVPAASVVEAVRLAEMDRPFEVMYYPRAGSPDFVVAEEVVDAAMRVPWAPGMRVRMSVETEDSSRMTWFQGTVASMAVKDVGPWARSPWRMLQVSWDEPEVLQNVRSVSPWQVELISVTPQIQAPYPVMKKLRVLESPEFRGDGESSTAYPFIGLKSKTMGSLSPSLLNYSTFPAGMQGARHNPVSVPSLSNFLPLKTNRVFSESLYGINLPQNLINVSTELNIGSTSQSEGSSPPSQGSIHDCGTAFNPTRKASGGSFQLFGQIIQIEQPDESDTGEEFRGTKGGALSHDFSISYPHKQLLNGLDVQCQRVSAVEACSL